MKRFALALAACSAMTVAIPAAAQTSTEISRLQVAQDRVNRELSIYRQETSRANYGRNASNRQNAARTRLDRELSNLRAEIDRFQPLVRSGAYNSGGYNQGYNQGYGQNTNDANYDPTRDYRDGNYEERTLSENDRVYAGTDGRYYCRRNDGSTGLIVGGIGGGVLGNVIGGSGNRTVGSILGAIGGAVAGRAIDRGSSSNNIRCR